MVAVLVNGGKYNRIVGSKIVWPSVIRPGYYPLHLRPRPDVEVVRGAALQSGEAKQSGALAHFKAAEFPVHLQGLSAVDGGPGKQLEFADGAEFFQYRKLPVGGQAVGANSNFHALLHEGVVAGQAVFDVQVGVGAGGPVDAVLSPGFGGADARGVGQGIMHEEGPAARIHMLKGVADR